MAPKEPTKHQLSSRLSYSQTTPAFLQKLKNKIAGIPDEEEDEYGDEFEDLGNGRVPIPRRPAIPERPADNPGSEDEFEDEKPQVVVLKEGKHLTEREAENIRRKEKGLEPLPESDVSEQPTMHKKKKEPLPSLSFSSGKGAVNKAAKKRKIGGDDLEELADKSLVPSKKKAKKNKALLSFGDEA